MHLIKSTWRGETPLIVSYWVVGVLGNLVISFIAYTFESLGTVYGESAVFGITAFSFFIFGLFYLVFSQVEIWRSAGNYIADAKSDNIVTSSSPFWGYVARFVVAVTAVRLILVIFDEFIR